VNDAPANLCKQHCSDLYFASFFLPVHKRSAVHAVAAFGHMIKDAIRADPARLPLFRDRLDEVYESHVASAADVIGEVTAAIRQFQIPKQHFLDFAEGCAADSTIRRYATWPSLEKHCYQSSGTIALIMSCVLGLTHSDAARYAAAMGKAIRLTQILRDVKADWEQDNRLYLPLEDLARFKYSERDLAAGRVNEPFRALMRFQVERARQLYRDSAAGVCWLAGDGSRMMASTLAVISSSILDAIARKDFDVLAHRICLSWPQKLSRLPRAWRLARRGPDEPLPDVF
jgi:phytoene synthase